MKRARSKRAKVAASAMTSSPRSRSRPQSSSEPSSEPVEVDETQSLPAQVARLAEIKGEVFGNSFTTATIAELMELPHNYRWESTRRHPYYVLYWRFARPDFAPRDDSEVLVAERARSVTTAFGILEPYPPGTPYVEIPGGLELGRGWRNGAVSQPTLKGLMSILALQLPAEVLAEVGDYLSEMGRRPDLSLDLRQQLLRPLLERDVPALNLSPQLMLTINPHAPQKEIVAAVEEHVRTWKAALNITERRVRLDLLDEILAVWDLKEGWLGERCDVAEEKTLVEVGAILKVDVSEVRRRYEAAFGRLFGQDYDPQVWSQAFAALKLLSLVGGEGIPRQTKRRPWAKKNLGKHAARKTVTSDRSHNRKRQYAVRDRVATEIPGLALDVNDLLEQRKSDDEILAELELSETYRSFVEYQRWRRQDLSSRSGT